MPTPVWVVYLAVVAIIVAAGLFGGFVNVAIATVPDGETPEQRKARAKAAVIAGVGASALVPLFLQTVSSTLLTDMFGKPDAEPWFVFAGFCLLAAISARRFIQTLSERVLREVQEAKTQASAARQEAGAAREAAGVATEQAGAAHEQAVKLEPKVQAFTDALRYGTRPTDAIPAADGGAQPARDAVTPGPDADDPWKGAFGGRSHVNGRKLDATLRSVDGNDWQSVTFAVTADPGTPALDGVVRFFLHPTFANNTPVVPCEQGIAKITIVSWGAFTAGAITPDGTRLELDLSQLPGAPEPWRSR